MQSPLSLSSLHSITVSHTSINTNEKYNMDYLLILRKKNDAKDR